MLHSQEGPRCCPWLGLELETGKGWGGEGSVCPTALCWDCSIRLLEWEGVAHRVGLDKMWGEPELSSGRDCEQTRSGLKCEGHSLLNRWEMPAQLCPGRKPPSTPTERSGGGCSLQIVGFCYSQESPSSTLVEHPCYPKDYKETISLSSFRTSPCTNQSDPRLPLDDRNVTLEGRSNASGCLVAVKKLFNFSACGQSQDCSFDGIYQPPVSGQFFVRQTPSSSPQLCVPPVLQCPAEPRAAVTSLQQSGGMQAGLPAWREKGIPHCNSLVFLPLAFQAFSAFYYNFKFLNLTEGQSLATVRETIEHFCARTWEDVCFLLWEAMGKLQKQMGGGRGAVTQPGR